MAASENNMFGDLFEEPDAPAVQGCSPHPNQSANGNISAPPPGRGASYFCGIKNQGATCYLNSLIQTLLLTPELREELFRLGPGELGRLEDAKNTHCKVRKIPIQLQMLLARLLLLDQYACGTEDLTNSFGWVGSEELQQHDVQELSRILFCAIEDSLVGTSGHNIIKNLYRGVSANTITCLSCGNVSENTEDFLDLNIAIATRNTLAGVLHNMFVETELMNGKNQYQCEKCETLVDARKGAVIKNLPPILTFSLLRFSFDYRTMRRFKETGRFEFPLSMNMRQYCATRTMTKGSGDQQEKQCYDYDLYSVIIHSGSAHGGHYHAYIRDVDGLGTVPPDYDPNPKVNSHTSPEKPNSVNSQGDSALEMLACVLAKLGGVSVPLDMMREAFREESGTSWAKQYRRKHGTMVKFLQNHTDTFAVESKSKTVSFSVKNRFTKFEHDFSVPVCNGAGDGSIASMCNSKQEKGMGDELDVISNGMHNSDVNEASGLDTSIDSEMHPLCNIWFDFNDSHVKPVTTSDILRQYEGRESAYMLFYRRRDLTRPLESLGEPQYLIPDHIRKKVAIENCKLDDLRTEYNFLLNVISLRVFLPHMFETDNWLIKLKDRGSKPFSECGIAHTISRQKTINELINGLADWTQVDGELESDSGSPWNFKCHIIQELPHGGIHLYDDINGNSDVLVDDSSLENGACIVLWNGKTLAGQEVVIGKTNEPILMNVRCKFSGSLLQKMEFKGISCASTVVQELKKYFMNKFGYLDIAGGLLQRESSSSDIISLDEGEVTKSLGELKDSYEETYIAEFELSNSNHSNDSNPTSENGMMLDISLGDVMSKNLRGRGFFGKPGDTFLMSRLGGTIETKLSTKVEELKCSILKFLLGESYDFSLETLHLYLERSQDGDTVSKLHLHENQSLSDVDAFADAKSVRLEVGPPPDESEYHISLHVQKGCKLKLPLKHSQAHPIVICKTDLVDQCIRSFVEKMDKNTTEPWHLRLLKSDREVGAIVSNTVQTIEKSPITHGCSLILCPGGIPSEGFLRIPVWYFERCLPFQDPLLPDCPVISIWEDNLSDKDFGALIAGHVEIDREATLFELKNQIVKLPFFVEKGFTTQEKICIRSVSQKLPTKFHIQDNSTVKRLRLGPGMPIAVQEISAIPSDNFISLRITFHKPGSRTYLNHSELMWDQSLPISKLPVEISRIINIPAEDILVARQAAAICSEWEIVKTKESKHKSTNAKSKTTNRKNTKNKKGQGKVRKTSSLDVSRVLKNGDVIRVKSIARDRLVEGGPEISDFRTEEDVINHKRSLDVKTKDTDDCQEVQHGDQSSNSITHEMKENTKQKKEEILRIHVDKF